jgi:pyrroline-5-carboxylate reductase
MTNTVNPTPTIGFIGYGNMAQAIAQGLVNAGVVRGPQIVACAAHYDKLERTAATLGVRPLHTPREVVQAADVVVIAIKPYQIEAVIKPLGGELSRSGKIVVSIAAGWDLHKYQDMFAGASSGGRNDGLGDVCAIDDEFSDPTVYTQRGDIHIQCTIPNTPMAVGKGVLVTEIDNTLDDAETRVFERMFAPISLIERVDSEHMGIAMVVAGCAPAFTDMYIEALGDAGVQYGLQRATAYRLAAKMVEGVGALYLATETHPGAMKDAVCSPGGTTIKGVAQLEKDGFRGSVINAVDAIVG